MHKYQKEIWFFLNHKEEFCAQYPNKYLVIRNRTMVGYFDSYAEAFTKSISKYQRFDFYVAFCPAKGMSLSSLKNKTLQLSERTAGKLKNQLR